ncbi:LPXTG cell wall anchor domain-containing protein [Enterococcus sp. LJL90]
MHTLKKKIIIFLSLTATLILAGSFSYASESFAETSKAQIILDGQRQPGGSNGNQPKPPIPDGQSHNTVGSTDLLQTNEIASRLISSIGLIVLTVAGIILYRRNKLRE